jgi:Rrf2 family protein
VLSRSSEYAIRALTFLAQHERDGRHYLARDMAEQLGIPAPFLGKVLQPLVTRGILHSQRGRSGGFRLDRPASEITLVQIVEAQERLTAPNVCILGQRECDDAHACPLHGMWMQASHSFHARLNETTLQDMVEACGAIPGCEYPYPSSGEAQAPAPNIIAVPGSRDDRAVSA